MRDQVSRSVHVLLATALALGQAAAARAQEAVVVQNDSSTPVPAVPASGPTAVQATHAVGSSQIVFLLGPFAAGKQVAVTGLTVASPIVAEFAPNPHAKDFTVLAVAAQPLRTGDPTCTMSSWIEPLTLVTVPAKQTFHASYTQPLLAPSSPPQTPWCLAVHSTGWVQVTMIGYVRQP